MEDIRRYSDFINEDIRQYLKPKSEEKIIKSIWLKIKDKSLVDKLVYIYKNELNDVLPQYIKETVDLIMKFPENFEQYNNLVRVDRIDWKNNIDGYLIINLNNYKFEYVFDDDIWITIKNII